jgi:hypothetical protein
MLVTWLERLARSTRDLLNIRDKIGKAGAQFKSLRETWADTTTPVGRLMVTIIGGIAEFERDGGAAEQANFDAYRMPRIDAVPKVETVIVPSSDFCCVGEPLVPPLATALLQRDLRRHRKTHPLSAADKPLLVLTERHPLGSHIDLI